MLSIPGYQITETIHIGSKTQVYRGYREQDQLPIIFKTLSADYPSTRDLACLQHEYALTKAWEENGQPRSYALIKYKNTQVLIQQDIGGVALSRFLASQSLPIDTFLSLALALTQSLNRIHQRHLIHKDINPANLIYNPDTQQVQIIDFGIATQLSRETTQLQNPGHLEGTLPYISPEQTGRMNRALDYRTDFYSLGATFYEMLTGVPPFTAIDPMELVHCHLARTPVPVYERRPKVPHILNELIQKLMEKTAEARYQSAFGLISDLECCRKRFNPNTAEISDFVLGLHDVSERFRIPQKLYGREKEVQQVIDAFNRISLGQTEMLLVAGYSGVGKTALVHEVHKPIAEKNGYCMDGKFDQFQRDIPYASLIQAFQELLRQLLTESPERIARWKFLLEQALGSIAQVIIDVIPEVELIIGPQPEVPKLPPAQAQNRINLVFQQFISTFATQEHPLVLFLDDLQWADLSSLQLIKLFMTSTKARHLLIIGAYRDNEVHPTHPLMLHLEEIRKEASITTIALNPLSKTHVQQLLSESLHCNLQQSSSLAQLCMEKTEGNPFFLNQFLRALVEAQQICFDHTKGCWQWELNELQQTPMTNNVVDLMSKKIQTLPLETQTVLQLAACIGNQFDLNTLTWACEQSINATAKALWPALQGNLLIPLDEGYKYINFEIQEGTDNTDNFKFATFKFIHDRVQQAAYSLIADDSKAIFHLRIGRRLLAHITPQEREERLFDLVYHWNKGYQLLSLASEKETLARLNLDAGKKARASAAYTAAFSYFQAGLKLLEGKDWTNRHDLTLNLHVAATEAAYLCAEFEEMDRLAHIVLKEAKNLSDEVNVIQIQLQARILQNQSLEAIKIALPILRKLGVRFPLKPNKLHVFMGMMETKLALLGKPIEDLAKLPPMTEEVPIVAMRLLSTISSAAYFAAPLLLPMIYSKQVYLAAKHGNTALTASGYAGYGLVMCGGVGDIETGYRFGKTALASLENFPSNGLEVRTQHLVATHIRHWKDQIHERLPILLGIFQNGMQTGDFEYAGYAAFTYCSFLYAIGRELHEVQLELEKYTHPLVQYKQEHALHWQKIVEQAVSNLLGWSDDPCQLKGNNYNEETTIISEGNRSALFFFHFYKMMLCYIFHAFPEALKQALAAEESLDGVISFPNVPMCHFYMALVRLALLTDTPKGEQQQILLKKTLAIQKNLKKWATHAPDNYLHKWHLVEAELARVRGKPMLAMEHYDQAISIARKNDFPQEEALANELAAAFYMAAGRSKMARTYLMDAHYGYQQWGAVAKSKHLEEQYPQWFAKADKRISTENSATMMRTFTTQGTTSGVLDLATVMKASQSISGEIILERLLEKLMRIAIENAGAEKGFLLLKKENQWWIEAEGNVNEAQVKVVQSSPNSINQANTLSNARNVTPDNLPLALIQYVELTKEALVLDDASGRGRFINDPYIRQTSARSILCAPILLQGKLAGMLYLENNLIEGTFTADRLEVLKILSSQAAISIENARVYENLESTVAQRTAALSDSNAALSIAYNTAEIARQHAENAEQQATQALNELRSAQTQLIQSAKMASLGHLVAGVAHELNTPIGNALTTASILADSSNELKVAMSKDEMRKAMLIDYIEGAMLMTSVISRSCQRAATLINSFKQVAVDQTSEQRRSFHLHSLVEDNIAALRAGFNKEPWVIMTHIPKHIQCDSYPGPLGQVIANLVQNAVIHAFIGRETGLLKITATQIDNSIDNTIEIILTDDGIGMESGILARIFEPFYTTQTGQGGPGLGLSISLNLVTGILGGTLEASSEPLCGSQFTLRFPQHAPDRTGIQNPSESSTLTALPLK
jgi:predicted ATPase/C4-dicarboxylate-specific signal transduction histidine kinase